MQMMHGESSKDSLPVRSDSEVARWTRGRSRGRVRTVEAVDNDGRTRTVFVVNQLLIDRMDPGCHDILLRAPRTATTAALIGTTLTLPSTRIVASSSRMRPLISVDSDCSRGQVGPRGRVGRNRG